MKDRNISPDNNPRDLLTIEAVAARLGVSSRTIHRWAKAGKFPKPDRVLGRTVWTTDSLNKWEESRLIGGDN